MVFTLAHFSQRVWLLRILVSFQTALRHFARLGLATSLGPYGLILRVFGGRQWQANCLLALGMILLLIWKPGQSPNLQAVEPS